MDLYQSPKNRIQHPASKTFGTAILLTDLLFGFVLWILSGRMSSQILIVLLGVMVLTLALSLWMIIRGFFLDPSMLHAFVIQSFSDRSPPMKVTQDFDSKSAPLSAESEDIILYLTLPIPEREVRFSSFPNNLGLDAIKDLANGNTNIAAQNIEYYCSNQFCREVEALLFEGSSDRAKEKGLTFHSISEVIELDARFFGYEFRYRNSEDRIIRKGKLYKHINGYDKILNCLINKYVNREKNTCPE